MINTILVDDEQQGILNLKNILQKNFPSEISVLGTANSVDEAEKVFFQHKPELIFLDIEMPEKNGFELLKKIKNCDVEVIFVTAFSNYGIDAVKFSALDYILKPIDIEELKNSIQKAKNRIEAKKINQSVQNLVEYLKSENDKSKHKIAISSLKETRFVLVNEILHCESSNSYTTFFLENGEELISTTSLYEYELLLEKYGFIRCHQSHLVNKNFVKSFKKENGNLLLLTNNVEIPVSRQKKDDVKKRLMKV